MAEKTKTRKERKIILRFLRLFPEYRGLEKTIQKKDEALDLSAAVIRSNKSDSDNYQKKIASDSNLIESLNRYIAALEGKAAMQAGMIQELKQRLGKLLVKPKYKRAQRKNPAT